VRLIDGRAIAAAIGAEVAAGALALASPDTARASGGPAALAAKDNTAKAPAALAAGAFVPVLAVVLPTQDEAARWYARSLSRAAARAGIDCRVEELAEPSRAALAAALTRLSADDSVHGIICQAPLPDGVPLSAAGEWIDPAKDVDGASPVSLGRLAAGLPGFAPATAAAVLEILRHEQVPLEGASVVVAGRSVVVGKPAALLLLAQNATVTVCHSRTAGLARICSGADVLVSAIGRPGIIGAGHVRSGAVVIDVGTTPTPDGKLAGDVDAAAMTGLAGLLTPVPGGVGPVTTALLLRNVLSAARASAS
jgi:methylenetetrahydrofolate dehydrogenase (NADP+)/methenyltetrahydrofolate cyclohydrolase